MIKIKMNPIKKIRINRNFRFSIIVILCLLIITSAYSAYAVFQPTTIEKTVITCNYAQTGHFSYVAYLKNNTIYDNASILLPGQGTIFRRITDHINASFSYTFNCDQPVTIKKRTYTLIPQIQTNIWNKTCDEVIPGTTFNSTHFSINFPIDYTYYEGVITQINNETGVNAGQSILVITCDIIISAETENGNIYESLYPSINVPLAGSTIEINGNLSQSRSGALTDAEKNVTSGSPGEGSMLSLASFLFFAILVMFILFTKSEIITTNKIGKQMKKIKKKYGEWIVEINKPPQSSANPEVISTKSMEDLSKISEELGKPIIHYNPENPNDEHHIFYVLDGPTVYEYVLHSKKDQSDMECPICKAKITIEKPSDEDMEIICPECGNKIFVSTEKSEGKSFVKSLTSHLTRTKSE